MKRRDRDGISVSDLWKTRGRRIGRRWRFRVWDPRRRGYHAQCFEDDDLGWQWALDLKAKIRLRQVGLAPAMLDEIAEEYLEAKSARRALHPSTEATIRRIVASLVAMGARDMRSSSFGVIVQRYINEMPVSRTKARNGRAAVSTTLKHLHLVRGLVRYARDHELVSGDPLRSVIAPRAQSVPREVLKIDEMRKLVASDDARDPRWVLAVLMMYTGMRLSEARAVKWEDIDWDGRCLRVTGKGQKTRNIEVQPELYALLDRIGGASAPSLRVGTIVPPTPAYTWNSFRSMLLGVGIMPDRGVDPVTQMPRRISPHTFRHSFAALALAAGANALALRAWLGHADADLTAYYSQESATYRHLTMTEGWVHGRFELRRPRSEATG